MTGTPDRPSLRERPRAPRLRSDVPGLDLAAADGARTPAPVTWTKELSWP